MLVEVRQKAQITIPKGIIKKLNIKEGDQLDISERNGKIQLVPVVLCPSDSIAELKREIATLKLKVADGQKPEFDQVDNIMDSITEG